MNFIRKASLGLAATLLTVMLFGFGFSWSITQVFGTSHDIKQALRQSHFYDEAVGAALDQAQKDQKADSNGSDGSKNDVPVDKPEIRTIIQQAFPPEFLQTQTEQVLDQIYGWLDGSKSSLAFTVDLTEAKTRLADGVGTYATQHLSSLPVCAAGSVPADDVDVFSATCVPKGYDIHAAAVKAREQILSGDFLKDTKLTSESIKTGDGQTLNDQLHAVPGAFSKVHQGVIGLILFSLLLAAGVVFLSLTWQVGLRRLAIILISVGAVSTILAWAASFGLGHAKSAALKDANLSGPWQHKLFDIAQILANDVRTWWMGYGITLLVLGIGTLVGLHYLAPKAAKTDKPADKPAAEPTGEDSGETTSTTAPDKQPKPAKAPAPDKKPNKKK